MRRRRTFIPEDRDAERAIAARTGTGHQVLPKLRQWFPQARLVGWKYELAGGRNDLFEGVAAARGMQHRRVCSTVRPHGEGFAVSSGRIGKRLLRRNPALPRPCLRLAHGGMCPRAGCPGSQLRGFSFGEYSRPRGRRSRGNPGFHVRRGNSRSGLNPALMDNPSCIGPPPAYHEYLQVPPASVLVLPTGRRRNPWPRPWSSSSRRRGVTVHLFHLGVEPWGRLSPGFLSWSRLCCC